jgi:sec-independent protein translocase protein TatA
MWKPGLGELLVVLVIVIVIFGAKRIPEIFRGFGEGIRSFKDGLKGDEKPEEKK